jgi:ribosomal protein S18 acetylase RimI-like enzyme
MGIVCDELFGKCLPFMVVENVAILKLYHQQGVARELLIMLEEYAKQKFYTTILFVSSEHRTGAYELYESVGYGIDKVNGYR